MANDADNHVDYWVSVPQRYAAAVYALRHWVHPKVATEPLPGPSPGGSLPLWGSGGQSRRGTDATEPTANATNGLLWLRGLTADDVESPDILSLPGAQRYYLRDAQLYPVGKQLPARVAPTLLWTDLVRGLKVELPAENFNYFGVRGEHAIELVASSTPVAVTATVIDLKTLGAYLHDAPRVRLAPLRWTVLTEADAALIVGTPLLPLPGRDYYQRGRFLLPAGYDFRYPALVNVYAAALEDGHAYWFLLDVDGGITKVSKADFNELNKGSFRSTFQAS